MVFIFLKEYLWVSHLWIQTTLDQKYLGGWGQGNSRKFQKIKLEFVIFLIYVHSIYNYLHNIYILFNNLEVYIGGCA